MIIFVIVVIILEIFWLGACVSGANDDERWGRK